MDTDSSSIPGSVNTDPKSLRSSGNEILVVPYNNKYPRRRSTVTTQVANAFSVRLFSLSMKLYYMVLLSTV